MDLTGSTDRLRVAQGVLYIISGLLVQAMTRHPCPSARFLGSEAGSARIRIHTQGGSKSYSSEATQAIRVLINRTNLAWYLNEWHYRCTRNESSTRNFVAAGHLLGEQASRVDSVPSCPQALHVLHSVGRYRVLIRACVVEIDEGVICTQFLCLNLDLPMCKSELSLDYHGNEQEVQSTETGNTNIFK